MKITLFLLVVMISSCLAANWYVSPIGNDANSGTSTASPFRTINKAYSVSKSGDTILLMPGLYTGSSNLISFQSSRNLTSQDPNAKAVINGQGSCLSVYAGYSTSISVSFSQIQFNGCSDAISISTYSGSSAYVDVTNVEFSGVSNRAISYSPSSGGLTVRGIAFDKCATALSLGTSSGGISGVVTVSDCTFTGSSATDKAILSYNAANSIRINNSVFRSYGSAAVDISYINDVNFNNCSFLNNLNTALKLNNIGTGLLQDTTFQNNNGTNGGAIYLSGTSSTLLGANNSYFFNNQATNGGAAYVYGATFNVQFSTITSNSAVSGGDYYCSAGGHVYEYSCKSSGNTGGDGGCSL